MDVNKQTNKGINTMNKDKLTNKMIINYLVDCLGYDKDMIDDIKEDFDNLIDCLSGAEIKDCCNYSH